MFLPIGDILHADRIGSPSCLGFEDADDAIGIADRQGPQEYRVHHAEDRGAGADPECERHKRRQCGKRILAPDPQGVSNVLS